jgi:hypothetical protein
MHLKALHEPVEKSVWNSQLRLLMRMKFSSQLPAKQHLRGDNCLFAAGSSVGDEIIYDPVNLLNQAGLSDMRRTGRAPDYAGGSVH